MAASGRWCNLSDWLLYSLINVRKSRVALYCQSARYGTLFLHGVADAIERFSKLPLAVRGGLGLDATRAQLTVLSVLLDKQCAMIEPDTPQSIQVLPMEIAGRHSNGTLVVGIALQKPTEDTETYFKYYCEYDPNAPACMLPVLPAPHALPVAPKPRLPDSDDEEQQGDDDDDEESTVSYPIQVDEDSNNSNDGADDAGGTMAAFFTKCPICTEIPFPPWHITTCGCLMCVECHAKLPNRTRCPMCRSTCAGTLVPQRLFAEVARANNIKLPCRYETCKRKIPWDMARAHHETCAHKDRPCPLGKLLPKTPACPWTGSWVGIGQHLMDAHGALEQEDAAPFKITEVDDGDVVVWTPRQLVLSVYRNPYKSLRGIVVKVLSLRPDHRGQDRLVCDAEVSGTFRGVSDLALTHSLASLFFPCHTNDAAFVIGMTLEEGDAGKRERETAGKDDDDVVAEVAKYKKARKEQDKRVVTF